jgi:phosphoglycolate phosphatase-like HAD superfamily hydrolase
MSKRIVLCDVDGTLADVNHRLHYIKNDDGTLKPYAERDWDSFNDACRYDVPNNDVIEILHEVANLGACTHLGEYTGREVYILSGRNEVTRRRTVKWLKKYVYSYLDYDELLIMRKADDRRPDTEVKLEMVRELGLTPDDVLCILDDRQCVVDMWRENGFRCLQVDAWEE